MLEAAFEGGERGGGIAAAVERAVAVGGAVGEEVVERLFEALGVPSQLLQRVGGEVDGGVEHHATDASGTSARTPTPITVPYE